DDEVAVPGGELLEREEELLALGSSLRAPEPLLGLAGGKVEPLELALGLVARATPALGRAVDHGPRRLVRIEALIRINGSGHGKHTPPSLGAARVEEALRPVEPAPRDARQRGHLVRAQLELAGAGGDDLAHGSFRQAAEADELTPRPDRLRNRAELVRDQDDDRVRGRLLEVLQERVRRVLV